MCNLSTIMEIVRQISDMQISIAFICLLLFLVCLLMVGLSIARPP